MEKQTTGLGFQDMPEMKLRISDMPESFPEKEDFLKLTTEEISKIAEIVKKEGKLPYTLTYVPERNLEKVKSQLEDYDAIITEDGNLEVIDCYHYVWINKSILLSRQPSRLFIATYGFETEGRKNLWVKYGD